MNLKTITLQSNNELTLTNNFNEAIFLDKYGNLLSGDFDCGIRGLDHNTLLDYTFSRFNNEVKWDIIHTSKIVRLVPESRTALITFNQILTDYQKELITKNNYKIEVYF